VSTKKKKRQPKSAPSPVVGSKLAVKTIPSTFTVSSGYLHTLAMLGMKYELPEPK